MTSMAESYVTARSASNLKSVPSTRFSASDVLGAAGMASQEEPVAMLLWGICYGSKQSQKWVAVDALARKLAGSMQRNGWRGNPQQIATAVLAYYLHSVCIDCDGVGYQLVPDTITRSDDPCPSCDGAGNPHPPADPAFMWLLRYVETLISVAAGEQMARLANHMELPGL